jgi:GH25 family lysozyme M1 (1,4-beta-N-acetylmuramidase)
MIIDVSKHNGNIDWSKVKGNVEAAVIRLGYRGYSKGDIAQDPKYIDNLNGCRNNGIPYSIYFFPCSINDAEAVEEANYIINAVQGLEISLPVFLDSEVSAPGKVGRSDNLSVEQRTHLLKAIIDNVKAAGIEIGVYASTSWLNNNLNVADLGDIPIWVAQYNTHCTYGDKYVMWQYTSNGSVNGIAGRVDCSNNISLNIAAETISANTHSYSVEEVAQMICRGEIGVGHAVRQAWCNSHGVDYALVRARVNELKGVAKKPATPQYVVGKVYKILVSDLRIRINPGTNYAVKTYSQLTPNARKHDSNRNGCLDVGTEVTCKGVAYEGNRTWIKIPSGWICAVENGKKYIG